MTAGEVGCLNGVGYLCSTSTENVTPMLTQPLHCTALHCCQDEAQLLKQWPPLPHDFLGRIRRAYVAKVSEAVGEGERRSGPHWPKSPRVHIFDQSIARYPRCAIVSPSSLVPILSEARFYQSLTCSLAHSQYDCHAYVCISVCAAADNSVTADKPVVARHPGHVASSVETPAQARS